jgi:hypothetical protein
LTTDALACTRERTSGRRHAVDAIAEVVAGRHSWRPFKAARRPRRNDRRIGVGSPVDPYRLGDTMSTRTIAIGALVIAVIIVVVLFFI